MKTKHVFQAMLMLALLLMALLIPAYTIAKTSHSKTALNQLIDSLEQKRLEHHIPGMAIAIVKDDKVVLSQGFGFMDLNNSKPVKTDTLFAIGSTTKAFTATLIAQTVDQGIINWDDKISQHLPSYRFIVDEKEVPITFRDALSHRTGYTRNDLLWANGQASRSQILATATHAEAWDEFRKNFHYNNVMYLAAAEAASLAHKKNWDQWLESSLLKPLGMKNTTSKHEIATQRDNVSKGYLWNEQTHSYDLLPSRNLNNVAPAGGIYSNVEDMAQWVRFLLNKGQLDKETLVSEEQLLETQQAQIKIHAKAGYGMGWFLHQWQGQPVIEHGGSIDGYAAQVALLPESNLGFVLLTNVTATPLQQTSMNLVWEHLAEIKELTTEESKPSVQIEEFVGEYYANFGSFDDEIFTFLIKKDGQPAVDVPGQTVYDLKAPDQQGKWYFTMTDTIAISFDRADDGSVSAMRLHQNRMDFELPRKGVVITPEIDEAALHPFLGKYQSKVFKGEIEAVIQNHRLTLNVPNQMGFELHLPDADGHRQFRIKNDMSAVFEQNEQGDVTALTLYRNKAKVVETAPRTQSQILEKLPTIEDILKLRKSKKRLKALQKNQGFQLKGDIQVVNSGVKGTISTLFDNHKKFKQHIDFGVFGEVVVVANENKGATYGINPYTELLGPYLQQIRKEHPVSMINWNDHYESIEILGSEMINDRKTYAIKLKESNIPATIINVDAESGDILKLKTKALNPSMGSYKVQMTYHDFKNIHGLRIPFKTVIKNQMSGKTIIQYKSFIANQDFNANTFSVKQP